MAHAAVTSLYCTLNLLAYPFPTNEIQDNPKTPPSPTNTLFKRYTSHLERAYAAVTSLFLTPNIVDSSANSSAYPSTNEILQQARTAAESLLQALEKFDEIKNSSQGVMDVDARIRDEAFKLEDALEFYAIPHFLAHSKSHGDGGLYLDFHELRYDIDAFANTAAKMVAEYEEELNKQPPPRPHEEDSVGCFDTNT